jgi:hypothetical protein
MVDGALLLSESDHDSNRQSRIILEPVKLFRNDLQWVVGNFMTYVGKRRLTGDLC